VTTAASRKNLVIAMALAAAGLLALNRWVVPLVFDLRPIRDGAGSYSADDTRLRLAVWEAPRPLEGELDSEARESHVRASPDGRWIAFAAGEPGLGADLFLAECVGGVPQAPRALAELNSGADDLAPAWGPDALYFASDRADGGGGFDLYRATWDGVSFGAVEALASVNSAANESDPAPSAGALYFASDRGGAGFDLFVERVGDGGARVERVDVLASTFEERDPFVTPDGRALYFASNRHLGGADFDLHRSFRDAGAWLAPERLAGLDSASPERGPATSADGFTLHFVREGDASAELLVSRSIELFRGAAPARGWADLALMAALLLLAAVAALSKRWEGLDLLYKCALASLLAHLLILALLRYLYPEAELWDQPRTDEPRIRVRLEAPIERTRGLVERGGELEAQRERRDDTPAPERVELARAQEAEVALPAPSALERSEGEPQAAPAPREVALERELEAGSASAPEFAAPSEPRERRRADEVASAAPVPTTARAARVQREHEGPLAIEIAPAPRSESAPAAATLAKRADVRASDSAAGAYTAAPVERSSASDEAAGGPALALPSEARPRLEAGEAPAARLEARSFDSGREVAGGEANGAGPERAQVALGVEAPANDVAPGAGSLTQRRAPAPKAAAEFAPAAGERAEAPDALRDGPALALPSESRARMPARDLGAAAESAPAPVAIAPQRRATPSSDSGPGERIAPTTGRSEAIESAAPASKPLAAAPRASAADAPQAPRRLDDTPYRSRFGTEKETALREHGGTEETERAVANGLRYLAARQRRDGSWGSPNDRNAKYRDVRVGKSALALLAFLGAGHTPGSETEHAAVAELAVRWLLSTQDPATGHFGDCEAYGHGIATYALAECFALTRDARLGEAVQIGVQRILEQQIVSGDPRSVGGWSYFYPDGAVFDRWPRASITAWQVMALESARLGGFEVPDVAFERAAEFLRGCWDQELGRFRYSHDPQRLRSGYATLPGSTPAALFALSLLGEDLSSAEWSDAVGFVGACAPDGYRWDGERAFVERASGNLYFWYYGSLALFRSGGAPWERWNVALKESLPPAQEADGSWPPLDVYSEYAGDDDRDRVYSTALCVLSLEVYYRYFTPLLKVR
jgi:hypothetical protein